ncbi:MAG TPA: hypothetical protein VGO57_00525 [Verrucomicrobiae bacterium]|jgi:hypothetical protein
MKPGVNDSKLLVFDFNFKSRKLVSAFLLLVFVVVVSDRAQVGPLGNVKEGHSKGFTSDQYYEPPNGQHIKMRMTGSSTQSLPDGVLVISDLRIELFSLNGRTEAVINAPQCNYSIFKQTASSDGHLEIQTGDGTMVTTGDGFLWRQSDGSLNISNHVHTVVEAMDLKLMMP